MIQRTDEEQRNVIQKADVKNSDELSIRALKCRT
jgi:hypothetical protein